MNRDEIIKLLKKKNLKLDDFNTATLSCITNIDDFETDIEKADKYIEFIEQRQIALDEITAINELIEANNDLKLIYNSNDEEIIDLRNQYKKTYEEIEKMQTEMNKIGERVLTEMRAEFKIIKQKQNFNNAYFDSPYTKGTKFDIKQ